MSWIPLANLPTLICSEIKEDKTAVSFRNNKLLSLGVEETLLTDSSAITLMCYLIGQMECFTNHFEVVHMTIWGKKALGKHLARGHAVDETLGG